MTEYIDIRAEPTDDPDSMRLIANVDLSLEDDPEVYHTPEEGEEGSPVAQALFMLPGLAALTIDRREMLVTRMDGVEWYDLIEDVRDALRDFFL